MKNQMFDIRAMFPKASKSFLSANPPLSLPSEPNKTPSRLSVGSGKGKRGVMNKTESEYSLILEAMKRKGEILRYEFEGVTLRFANVKYTPDFVVFVKEPSQIKTRDDFVKIIEVKGPFIRGNRERAVERFRHAKTYWPEFQFEMWQRTKASGWQRKY